MDAGDLTTLAAVKAYLGVTVATDDALLGQLITAASAWIKTFLNRDILAQTYVEELDGHGTRVLCVDQYPVTAVTSVTVDGLTVAPSLVVARGRSIMFRDGSTWPRGIANVQINYTAGAAAPPADIAQACNELVAWRYRERDRIGQSSKTIGEQTTTYQTQDVPNDVKTLLLNWRKVTP